MIINPTSGLRCTITSGGTYTGCASTYVNVGYFGTSVGIERGQSRLGDLDLLSEAEPGEQPTLALHEMVSEIAHQAYAEDWASNEAGAPLDLLENHHAT